MSSAYPLTLYSINEPVPGARWKALFGAVWPGYRQWYLSEGEAARPTLSEAAHQLATHMPELVPTWRRLVALTGDDPLAAAMLTLWDPPQFLPGCSQAVITAPEPALVRNYDYSPELFEQVIYSSKFGQKKVIGTSDCLWGLLDGMNDDGLCVSLAFGGRPGSGPGFAAPLVVRYLLEVASTTAEASELLTNLPVSMSYNLTMVDADGHAGTAFVAPGQPAEFTAAPVATNHRGDLPEFPDHARRFRSVERQQRLQSLVVDQPTATELSSQFLAAPLFNDNYEGAFGTLYTAVYRPAQGLVEYRWPDDQWLRSFDDEGEEKLVVLQQDGPQTSGEPVDVPTSVTPTSAIDDASTSCPTDGLDGLTTPELAEQARRALTLLARRPDKAAFGELLGMYEAVGTALGESARTLADHGSWSQVADVAGVTKQAAWYRWRT